MCPSTRLRYVSQSSPSRSSGSVGVSSRNLRIDEYVLDRDRADQNGSGDGDGHGVLLACARRFDFDLQGVLNLDGVGEILIYTSRHMHVSHKSPHAC